MALLPGLAGAEDIEVDPACTGEHPIPPGDPFVTVNDRCTPFVFVGETTPTDATCQSVSCDVVRIDDTDTAAANRLDGTQGSLPPASSLYWGSYEVWTSGSVGIDADTVDGQHASAFLGATAKAVDADKLDGLDATELTAFLVPAGAVMAFDLAVCPSGWTAYAAAAGRNVIGVGAGTGLTVRALGATGGEEGHTLSASEMPVHSHVERIPTPQGSSLVAASASDAAGGSRHSVQPSAGAQDGGDLTTGDAGGDQAHNVMDPFIALLYCKKS